MVNLPVPPRGSYKAFLWDYDDLLSRSDAECCFSLSEREIQILLANLDTITWSTRYKPTHTDIDHEILLKWQGNLARKLMSGCCPDSDAIYRYLPDGTYERSDDGGETWSPAPTEDPRYGAPLAPPLSGADGDNKRCAAADNVRDQFKDMRNGTIGLLEAGTTALLIVSFLVGAIGGILAISVIGIAYGVILFSLAGYLLSLTPESVEEQIDDTALDLFRCLVYCNMGSDGRLLPDGLAALLVDIADQFDDFPETFFYSITAGLGETGINNAAALGGASATDCSECDCNRPCVDEDNIILGTLVEVDGDNITIAGVLSEGVYKVTYGSDLADYCCLLCEIEYLPDVSSGSWFDCDGNPGGGSPIGQQVRRLEYYRVIPFSIRFRFAGEEGCE